MKIVSRANHKFELEQMESFAASLTQFEFARWVPELYFDSEWSICIISIDPVVANGSWVADQVKKLAEQIFSQFEMFGVVYHGTDTD